MLLVNLSLFNHKSLFVDPCNHMSTTELPSLEITHGTQSNCCGALCFLLLCPLQGSNTNSHFPHRSAPYQKKIAVPLQEDVEGLNHFWLTPLWQSRGLLLTRKNSMTLMLQAQIPLNRSSIFLGSPNFNLTIQFKRKLQYTWVNRGIEKTKIFKLLVTKRQQLKTLCKNVLLRGRTFRPTSKSYTHSTVWSCRVVLEKTGQPVSPNPISFRSSCAS